ncbi:demethylmenaquinone methyltransferase protein [Rutstroemia sp. NJR-2017a BVV2]|nr:demethylmenaquinone methyltransferase protein [Rutstroemia sp. NJR-2017a BVV2]
MSPQTDVATMAGTNTETKDYPAIYSSIGSTYEDAFAQDTGLFDFLKTALHCRIYPAPPTSSTSAAELVGPFASVLSSAEHHVLGMDISETMVELSRKAVPSGVFEMGDMRNYMPKEVNFDGVFNILSLFILSREEIEAMAAQWSTWSKPGDVLCICIMAAEDPRLKSGAGEGYDEDGFCARDIRVRFMGNRVSVTLFAKEGWRWLLEENCFEVVVEKEDLYKLPPESDSDDEPHYFLIARKM